MSLRGWVVRGHSWWWERIDNGIVEWLGPDLFSPSRRTISVDAKSMGLFTQPSPENLDPSTSVLNQQKSPKHAVAWLGCVFH